MREIRFRASVTDNKGKHKRWVYGTPEFGDMGELYMLEGIGGRYLCQRETLGQLTGLKDKNGKEIYEGDIIDTFDGRVKVIWWKAGFYFKFLENKGRGDWVEIDTGKCVIVGDIYRNPGLLEV